jgi:hypothetical protein
MAAFALPLEAAIERAGGLPADVVRGLDRLTQSPPLFPVDDAAWRGIVATVADFATRFDGQARSAGWDSLALYSLHKRAPFARLTGMGVAFLIARAGLRTIAVSGDAIAVASYTGAHQRIYRSRLDPDARLAWELG